MEGAPDVLFAAFDRSVIPALVRQRLAAHEPEACAALLPARLDDWQVVAGTLPNGSGSAIRALISGLRWWQSPAFRVLYLNASHGVAIVTEDSGKGAWIVSKSTQIPARQFFHCIRLLRASGYGVDRLQRDAGLELLD